MKRILFFCIIIPYLLSSFIYADIPERIEEFIYEIVAFDGVKYSSTFVREVNNVIYLLADQNNLIIPKKAFVYYWPITNEWRMDKQSLDENLEGTLEVLGNNDEPLYLAKKKYTYYALNGQYSTVLKISIGKEAEEVIQEYSSRLEEYKNSLEKYSIDIQKYEYYVADLMEDIQLRKANGASCETFLRELNNLSKPNIPVPPKEYIFPPTNLQEAFVVNLPAGEYRMKLVTSDSSIYQDSEKKLVVFDASKKHGVGYEIIPGDRWTREEESNSINDVIYINGMSDLYLRVFMENKYNDYFYNKLIDNNSRGNLGVNKWVRLDQVPKAKIIVTSILKNNVQKKSIVAESAFSVKQLKGSTYGYEIVPYGIGDTKDEWAPSFIAFSLPITGSEKIIEISATDQLGNPLKGSRRQIRIVDKEFGIFPFIFYSILPIFVMIIVRYTRQCKYFIKKVEE